MGVCGNKANIKVPIVVVIGANNTTNIYVDSNPQASPADAARVAFNAYQSYRHPMQMMASKLGEESAADLQMPDFTLQDFISRANYLWDQRGKLIGQMAGKCCIKSFHGTYLSATPNFQVSFKNNKQQWEDWYIEDWGLKGVVFKAIHSPGEFLSARDDHTVSLVDKPQAWEIWQPIYNENGTWSFFSYHGNFLSSNDDGTLRLADLSQGWEEFWIEHW